MRTDYIIDALGIAVDYYCEDNPEESVLKDMLESAEEYIIEEKSCIYLINIMDAVEYYIDNQGEHAEYVQEALEAVSKF